MKKTDTELISDFIKGVASTLVSIFTVLSCAFKKRATLLYPEVKPEIPDTFRGKIEIDTEKCIGCGKCEAVCPMAVEVTKNINCGECIRCGKCRAACPNNAITADFYKERKKEG